ncbi:hypothetical protein FOCC_FOCC014883 [Frankliniella occidentalis]|nr:hypothetical protein FOCC_FOCC014883 [Frankliniella occidentalis]
MRGRDCSLKTSLPAQHHHHTTISSSITSTMPVCEVCNKKFKTPMALSLHFGYHGVGDRPYKCMDCVSSLSQNLFSVPIS